MQKHQGSKERLTMPVRRRILLIAVPVMLCVLIFLLILNTGKQGTAPETEKKQELAKTEQLPADASLQQVAGSAVPSAEPAMTDIPAAATPARTAAPVRPVAALPYVGMSEYSIGNTEIGKPTRKEFRESKFGKGTLGYYYWDQNGKCMFIARTEDGVVKSVTDMGAVRRDAEKIREKSGEDPYQAGKYSNEEDFWDDHRDDFIDYYAAEDYWREHQ